MNPNAYQYNGSVNLVPGQGPEKSPSAGGGLMTGGGMPVNKNALQDFQTQYFQQQQQQQQQLLAQQQASNQMFQNLNINHPVPSGVQNLDSMYPSQLPYNANPAMFVKNQAYAASTPSTNPALVSASPSPAQMTAQQQQQLLIQRAMELQNHQQLDKSRVALLLDINVELLKETVNIQGMSKPTGATDGISGTNEVTRDPANEKVYQECMRRLQANLAYLAAIADRSHRPTPLPPSPAILVAPPELPNLIEPYKRLQSLFPGVKTTNPSSLQPGQITNGSAIAAHSRNLSQNVNVQQIMAGSSIGAPSELLSNITISPQIGTGSKPMNSMLPISPSEQQVPIAQHQYHVVQNLGGQQPMPPHEEVMQPSQTISPQLSLRQQLPPQLGLNEGLDPMNRNQQHRQEQNMMQHMQRMQQSSMHPHQPQGQIIAQNPSMSLQSTQGLPHQGVLTQPNLQYMQTQQQMPRQQQMMNPTNAAYPQNFYTQQ